MHLVTEFKQDNLHLCMHSSQKVKNPERARIHAIYIHPLKHRDCFNRKLGKNPHKMHWV